MKRRGSRQVLLTLSIFCFSVLMLCSCIKFDVSLKPRYNYCFQYNHVYRTKSEILFRRNALFCLYLIDEEIRNSYLDPDILPKGTLFLVEKIIFEPCSVENRLVTYVRLLNGHFKGQRAITLLTKIKYDAETDKPIINETSGWLEIYPDPEFVEDLGEMPEYHSDPSSIPEPEDLNPNPNLPISSKSQN